MAIKKVLTPPIEKKKPKYSHPTRTDLMANSRQQMYLEENPHIPNGAASKKSSSRWYKPQPVLKKTTKK